MPLNYHGNLIVFNTLCTWGSTIFTTNSLELNNFASNFVPPSHRLPTIMKAFFCFLPFLLCERVAHLRAVMNVVTFPSRQDELVRLCTQCEV